MKPIIKQLLRESLFNEDKKDKKLIDKFVEFAKKHLEIKDGVKIYYDTPDDELLDDDKILKIQLCFNKTPDLRTTAYYHNGDKRVKVYVKDRAIIDVCRSIAHELVHHKQNISGAFEDAEDPGADGSEFENEANAVAGIIIRKWGRLHPEIYE